MITFYYLKHGDTPANTKEKIAYIKNLSWNYGIESQLKWLENNLVAEDLHIMAYTEGELVAYLNLVNRKIIVNGIEKQVLGIGNVCAGEKGKGYGKLLMQGLGQFLNREGKIGVLFCKEQLVPFYKKHDWQLVEKNKVKTTYPNTSGAEIMIYNLKNNFQEILIIGDIF